MRVEAVSEPQYESLVDLLCELHTYYNEGSFAPREMVRSYLVDTLLASDSPLDLVVAIDAADRVVGFTAISLTYSLVEPAPGRRRHCWLKEATSALRREVPASATRSWRGSRNTPWTTIAAGSIGPSRQRMREASRSTRNWGRTGCRQPELPTFRAGPRPPCRC